jgi:general secretion pathway protein K
LKDERGFALVITLIITALLVALTAEFVDEVYVDTSLGHNFVAGQQASLLASSGVAGGIKLLQLTHANQQYTSLLDRWAQPINLEEEQGKLVIAIEEESGKLNLNCMLTQPTMPEMATRLFKNLELAPDLADALLDWLDLDDDPHGGAETAYYNRLKPPYAAKNSSLETLEELSLVKGFAGKTFERLQQFVTIYPDTPNAFAAKININTAPPEVIAALADGMTKELIDRVLEYRKTTPFKQPSELATKIPGLDRVATPAVQALTTIKGAVYRIRSIASVRETSRTVEAVVRILGQGPKAYTVLYWREF